MKVEVTAKSFRVIGVLLGIGVGLYLSDFISAKAEESPEALLNLRDPFRRPDIPIAVDGDLLGLEQMSVDKFKMIGVATGPKRIRAMLQDPAGRVYFVSENTKIGLRKGVITQITPQVIKVKEKIVNVVGKEEDVIYEIRLPQSKGI